MTYFGITIEGNIVFLGTFDTADEAENAAAEYGTAGECDACGHASDDVVYYGNREHFNAMFDQLDPQVRTTRLDEARKEMVDALVEDRIARSPHSGDLRWYVSEYYSKLDDIDLQHEFRDAGLGDE